MFVNRRRHDSAVSDVIGTVLIVALVVILAAIVAVTVFGFSGILRPTTIVGVTAVRGDFGNVTVTYTGGASQNPLYWLSISVNGSAMKTLGVFGGTTPLEIGNSTTVGAPVPGKDHIVVVGDFADGTRQIVLDTIV